MTPITRSMCAVAAALALFFAGACEDGEGTPVPPPLRFHDTTSVDGMERSFIVKLPRQYWLDSAEFPLVIALHGFGGSGSQFETDYHFSRKADEAGFVAVYPNGAAGRGALGVRTWNAGSCCGFAMEEGVNDVKFISRLIDKLIGEYRINDRLVYVTGMSNGGMMAYRLAAEIPEKIAAVAAVGCTMVFEPVLAQPRPMAVIHIHSILDEIIPYYGATNPLGYYFPPVESVLSLWAQRNDCLPEARVVLDGSAYKHLQWTNEAGDILLEHYLTYDGGHSWPGGEKVRKGAAEPSKAINANDRIWDFFSRYALP